VLRDPKNVAIVTADEFFECRVVAALGGLNERQLFANWSGYFVLDGFHSLGDAVFSGAKSLRDLAQGAKTSFDRNCYSTW
jgi:hypothetical protein